MSTKKEIKKLLVQWFTALETGDPDAVTRLYAPDALLLPTLGQKIRRDQRGIRDYFARTFLPMHPVGSVTQSSIRILGEAAVHSGFYRFTLDDFSSGRRVAKQARFTFVYRRSGAEWKIVEHHSSVMPESA